MNQSSGITRKFLVAAKKAELDGLQVLTSNCRVVTAVTQLIHQLQRERGIANVFLGSKAATFSAQLREQHKCSREVEHDFRHLLRSRYLCLQHHSYHMRFLSAIALALEGLDQIPTLREQVVGLKITTLNSTDAYCRLIGSLMNVIYEAADVSGDASITKLLVSLFNFIKAKELAGQERAWGAIGFTQHGFDNPLCARIKELIDAQDQSIERFLRFASAQEVELWQRLKEAEFSKDIIRLREMIMELRDTEERPGELSEIWYEVATRRIDAFRKMEELLTTRLLQQGELRLEQIHQQIHDQQKMLNTSSLSKKVDSGFSMLFDQQFAGLHGADHENGGNVAASERQENAILSGHKSFYDLICDQAHYIKQMASELEEARQSLNEQKIIDRAKLMLMRQSNMTEGQAYRSLQKAAMSKNLRLADLAFQVVSYTK